MTPSHSSRGGTRYRYYICLNALTRGRQACPGRLLAAHTIEPFVVAQLQQQSQAEPSTSRNGAAGPAFPDVAAWQALATEQQAALLRQWVQRVDFDGPTDQVTILLRASQDDNASPNRRQPRAPRHATPAGRPGRWPHRLCHRL
jgi:hypothetical protein